MLGRSIFHPLYELKNRLAFIELKWIFIKNFYALVIDNIYLAIISLGTGSDFFEDRFIFLFEKIIYIQVKRMHFWDRVQTFYFGISSLA